MAEPVSVLIVEGYTIKLSYQPGENYAALTIQEPDQLASAAALAPIDSTAAFLLGNALLGLFKRMGGKPPEDAR